MKIISLLFLTCLFTLSNGVAQAQPNQLGSNLASILGGSFDPWNDPAGSDFAPQTSGDTDLGEQLVLMPQNEYQPFSLQLSEQVLWTSNAGLTDLDVFTELDDIYSVTNLRLNYLPQIGNNSYAEISVGYALYRYLDHSSLNFDRFETSLGVIHSFRNLNDLSVWLRYNHLRLLETGNYDQLFADHSIELGLYYPVPLGARHLAFGSYSSEFSLDASPNRAGRHEHGLTVGYKYSPTNRFEFACHYRFHVFDYLENSRTDLLQSVGLSLTTQITDRVRLIASTSYSWNNSNVSGNDYKVADVGASLGFKLNF